MKVLLLGATGRTGKLVLKRALEQDLKVNALVRNSERIKPHPNLEIFQGDPADAADLEKAISDCNYVISVLNISRKTDLPWSPLRTPQRYLSTVMGILVALAEKEKIQRVVTCSAWGVAETRNDIPGWFRWFIDNSNIGVAYRDHERQEQILSRSNVDWTIVRPVGLTNFKRKQNIRVTLNNEPRPSLMISRAGVAQFMVDSLNNPDLINKMVTISKG